ncbi:protein bicaudal C [Rosa sericea]
MSKPRVTITLGRSGQVVERGGTSGSVNMRGERGMVSGGKRSMGDRLGSNAHGKRQRGDGIKWRGGDNTLHDSRISRNDLRLKLLRKRSFKQNEGVVAERKQMVPRPKLSKPAHSAVRYQMPQHKSETNESSFLRQFPPRETPADLYRVNPQRNFNSSQSREGFRARSPDNFVNTSYGPSPQRNFGELQAASSFRAAGAPRAGQFLRNGMIGSSQPTDSFLFRTKSNPQTAKPAGQLVPTNYSMQKVPYMGEEPLSVASLLHRLGLGKYAIIFQAEEVDMGALKQMGDKDLKELGIPMGPRKKILLALLARGKRPPPP